MITLGTEVKHLLPHGSGEAGFLPPGPMITLPKIAEGQRGDEEWTLDKRHPQGEGTRQRGATAKQKQKKTFSAVPSEGIQWKTHTCTARRLIQSCITQFVPDGN